MSRGPLAPLDGVPGVRGALVRAALVAAVQTAGTVLLAGGLAFAIARIVQGVPPFPALGAAAGGAVLRAVAGAVGEMTASRDARRAEDGLRSRLLAAFAGSPTSVQAAGGAAQAAVLATTRLHDLGPALAGYLPAVAQTAVVPPLVLFALVRTDPLSALLVALTLPLVPLFMALVGYYTANRTSRAARALDGIAGQVAELVRGLPVLTGLGRAAEQSAALATLGERYRVQTIGTLRLAFLSALVLELIATLSVALVAVTVGLRLLEGHLPLALGLTALLLAPEAYAPLRALGAAYHAHADAGLAAAQARAVLAGAAGGSGAGGNAAPVGGRSAEDSLAGDRDAGVADPPAAGGAPTARADLAAPIGPVRETAGGAPATLTVCGASVSYPSRTRPALAPVDLVVRPGELVALTGPSGSGKSTLLGAVAGTLPSDAVVSGAIAGPALRAVVGQHPRTTAATVAQEIRRHAAGNDASTGRGAAATATATDRLVIETLERVGVRHLTDRQCTDLSPGELQRVALARALARVERGATLALLDEPTAHLDERAAAHVAGVLAELRGRVGVLLVSHDPTLLAAADRIVTLRTSDASGTDLDLALDTGTGTGGRDRTERRRDGATDDLPDIVPTRTPAEIHNPVPLAGAGIDESAAATGRAAVRFPRWAVARAVLAGTLTSSAGVALTALSGWLVVRAAELPPVLTLLVAIAGVRACGLGRALLRWWERLAGHDAALRLATSTRVRVWDALARQGVAAERTPGHALSRVVGDVGLLQELSVRVITPPWVAGCTVALGAGVLALLDPVVAAGVLLVLAAALAAVAVLHRRVDAGAARAESSLRVETLRETATVLDGVTDLRAHGLAAAAADDLRALARRQGAAARVGVCAGALASGAVSAATGLAAVLAAALAWTGEAAGPVVAVLALTPLALAEPLFALVAARQRRGAFDAARARILAVLDEPVAAEPSDSRSLPRPVDRLSAVELTAGWRHGPEVLHGVDLATGTDGWLVVRGPSGSGKSTLLAVLLAALRPRSGSYRVSAGAWEVDVDRVGAADVRAAMAWLPQDSHVFASSLGANLAVARPRGEVTEAQMHTVLAAVGLTDLVDSMPAGLNTPVGSTGTALSGGERRRVAAARALLADRDVVLLDEPTAHLDPPTAAALIRDLRSALAGRVIVCVTHDDAVAAPGDQHLRLGRREDALTEPRTSRPRDTDARRPFLPLENGVSQRGRRREPEVVAPPSPHPR